MAIGYTDSIARSGIAFFAGDTCVTTAKPVGTVDAEVEDFVQQWGGLVLTIAGRFSPKNCSSDEATFVSSGISTARVLINLTTTNDFGYTNWVDAIARHAQLEPSLATPDFPQGARRFFVSCSTQ